MSDRDTQMGGYDGEFPTTGYSLVEAAASPDPRRQRDSLQRLAERYWKPLYKYLRVRWRLSNEQAKDATQGFLASCLEQHTLQRYDPDRAALRTYLRVCLDHYVGNEFAAAGRQKRGGGQVLQALEFDDAEAELRRFEPADPLEPDECFRREWVRNLFGLSLEQLRETCAALGKQVHFELFSRFDAGASPGSSRPTYEQLAEMFDLPVTQVTNHLAWTRREFRRCVLDQLRHTCGSDLEFREEARALLGVAQP